MMLPIPAFLARLAATAQALWTGRALSTTAWRLHRQCDIAIMTGNDIRQLALWGSAARGVN